MKTCIRCHQTKPAEAFHRHARMADGRLNKCAACVVECVREWRKHQPADARNREYEGRVARGKVPRKRRQSDIPRMTPEQYRESRKVVSLRYQHKRRIVIARPVTELDAFAIDEAIDVRRRREDLTGFSWHIDHRVPIHHPLACGLNVAANLQVVPGVWNVAKRNRSMADFWPLGY